MSPYENGENRIFSIKWRSGIGGGSSLDGSSSGDGRGYIEGHMLAAKLPKIGSRLGKGLVKKVDPAGY